MGEQNCKCSCSHNTQNEVDIISNNYYEDYDIESKDNNKNKIIIDLNERISALKVQSSNFSVIKESEAESVRTNSIKVNNKENGAIKTEEVKLKSAMNKNINNNNNNNNINQTNNSNNNTNINTNNNNNINNNIEKIFLPPGVSNVISEKKFMSLKDDDLVFSGYLKKMLNNTDKKSISFSDRFCVITKKIFAYYHSKESFIGLDRPLFSIENNLIIRIEEANLLDGSFYFCIVFRLDQGNFKIAKNTNCFTTVNKDNQRESMLGFKAPDKKTMFNWVSILNFLINF